MKKAMSLLVWFLAGFLVVLNSAQATTFNVTETTGGGCADLTPNNCTLQEALVIAHANGKSDTILIAPGTYSAGNSTYAAAPAENFSLAITGTGGAEQTILDGEGGILMGIVTIPAGSAADVTLTGLTFVGGFQATESGGGLLAGIGSGSMTIQDCAFRNNSASSGGGVFIFSNSGLIEVKRTTFFANRAAETGGGLALASTGSGSIQLTENIIVGNSSLEEAGGGIAFTQGGSITLSGNRFINNNSTEFGGIALTSEGGSISMTGNTVQGNGATTVGGMIVNSNSGSIILTANDVRDNSATDELGGIEVSANSGDVTLVNNIVFNNSAFEDLSGLGIQVNTGTVNLINNTIANNTIAVSGNASDSAGLVLSFGDPAQASAALFNNIIFGNSAGGVPRNVSLDDGFSGTGAAVGFFNNDFPLPFFSACAETLGCNPAVTVTSHVSDDPLLVNAAAGDLHLLPNSPAVNKGTSAVPGGLPATDFDGNPRVIGAQVDIGAFENGSSGVSVSPSILNFGDVALGSTSGQVLTITNDGVQDVIFSAMTLSDAVNYSLNFGGGGSPCGSATVTLGAGLSCTVEGIFGPESEGLKTATLTLNSNSSGTPSLIVQLFGAGTDDGGGGGGGGGGSGGGGGCSLGDFASPGAGVLAVFLAPLFYAATRRGRRP